MEKFLVVRFSSLGDIVLCSVVTRQLKEKYPDSRITFLTKSNYQSIARLLPGVGDVLAYDPSQSLLQLIDRLNRQSFDCLIDLHANWRSFWVRRLTSAKEKTVYKNHRFTRLLMVNIPSLPVRPFHTTQLYLDALSELGISPTRTRPELVLRVQERKEAEKFLSSLQVLSEALIIGVAPGGRWETKRWRLEGFAKVSQKLQQELAARLIFFGSDDESDVIGRLAKQVPGSIPAVGLELDLLAALIDRCNLVISNDSGLMHISSALNVPTLTIFGPTHPRLGFAPLGPHCKVITTNQPCSPCSLHGEKKCFQPARLCMDEITSEIVLEEALKLLHKQRPALVSDEK